MKKIILYLLAILSPFIFINNVSALESFSSFPKVLNPDSLGNYNLVQFTEYSYLFWVNGTGVSNYARKWSYQYDTTGKISNDKLYTVSTIAYINPTQVDSTDSLSGVGSPVVLLNGQSCKVEKQSIRGKWPIFNFEQGTTGNIDRYMTYDVDGLFYSIVCENIMIKDNTSYLDYFFPNSNKMKHFNVSYLQFTETTGNSLEQAIQENNNKLQDIEEKTEQQIQEQEKTNQELGDLNDNLTNSDAPDGMDSLGSASGWLPPGPVDSLLTLPLSMLNNISTSLGSTCKPINLPIPFVNENLTMPCLNTIYSQITGLGVFLNSIGTIAAGFMLYYYFKKLYAYIDNLLSLKNNGEGWGDV